MKDKYGQTYELISGKTYCTVGGIGYNIAVLLNDGTIHVLKFTNEKDRKAAAEKAIIANGWNPADWL